MKPEARALLRNQLDRQLSPLRPTELVRPRRGWVRAIREVLGMNGRQLAERMGIARSHLSQIESGEARDSVSLRTLRRAADALGCEFVYAFVPRDGRTLEEMVQERARVVAERIVGDVATTMALEAQSVDGDFQKREVDRIALDLAHTMRRDLWDK
jgi:predicted DNA-binding mobile mystery protein A